MTVALLQAALVALNAGRVDEAAGACDRALADMPDSPSWLQLEAAIALRRGDALAARRSATRSLAARPDHGPTLLLAAQAATAEGDFAGAVVLLEQATTVPDANEPAWRALALALHRVGRPALQAWARADSAPGAGAPAAYAYALALRAAGQLTLAEAALCRTVARDPGHAAAWFTLGLLRQDCEDEAGAEIAFRTALERQPDLVEAAVNLGIALQRQGRLELAIDAYRHAVALRPEVIGRVAQALTSSATGMMVLDADTLRRLLAPR